MVANGVGSASLLQYWTSPTWPPDLSRSSLSLAHLSHPLPPGLSTSWFPLGPLSTRLLFPLRRSGPRIHPFLSFSASADPLPPPPSRRSSFVPGRVPSLCPSLRAVGFSWPDDVLPPPAHSVPRVETLPGPPSLLHLLTRFCFSSVSGPKRRGGDARGGSRSTEAEGVGTRWNLSPSEKIRESAAEIRRWCEPAASLSYH